MLFALPAVPVFFESIPAYATTTIPLVPFYSQFKDITSSAWQKVGCGVTSLAMMIDYYKPAVSVDTVLAQAVAAGAYLESAGWTYKGLIGVANTYGLEGKSYDLAGMSTTAAFEKFKKQLQDGPLIASVHYKFDPKSRIPHLVVIDGITDGVVYYNDPAAKAGQQQISVTKFISAWKKRFIVLRPRATDEIVATVHGTAPIVWENLRLTA